MCKMPFNKGQGLMIHINLQFQKGNSQCEPDIFIKATGIPTHVNSQF